MPQLDVKGAFSWNDSTGSVYNMWALVVDHIMA